jgi:hypothetical protein
MYWILLSTFSHIYIPCAGVDPRGEFVDVLGGSIELISGSSYYPPPLRRYRSAAAGWEDVRLAGECRRHGTSSPRSCASAWANELRSRLEFL